MFIKEEYSLYKCPSPIKVRVRILNTANVRVKK